jgi:Xaa-Pro aminopeptidase
MLTIPGCRKRVERLREAMDSSWEMESPWDAAVIHLPEHLLYFANFLAPPASLNLHNSSFLLIERDGPVTLFTDNWLADAAGTAAVDAVVVKEWYACRAPALNRALVVAEAVGEHLERLSAVTIAAEVAHVPLHVAHATGTIADIEPLIRKLREVKDPDEIEAVRKGIRTAEAMHDASRALLEPGATEIEYYARLVERATVAAGTPFVMMCDLASGPRAAKGGGAPTDRRIEEGDLVLLDLFPYVEGYRGDITNTLVAGGRPSARQEAAFHIVEEALRRGEALLHPGTPIREIYRAMDAALRTPPGKGLVHHGGHNLGLGHPEAPEIVPDSDRTIEAGMIMTLEPGIYDLPTGGIRLEHDYLIGRDGPERMSNHRLGLA